MIAVEYAGLIPTVTLRVSWYEDADPPGSAPGRWSEPLDVPGCLFAPSQAEDMDGAERPNGDVTRVRFDFPKGAGLRLRGARVECPECAPGRYFLVEGDPVPLIEAAVPGPWSMAAWGVEADG